MKIGLIGSGEVAQSLAEGLIGFGHEVMIGTRDTTKKELRELKKDLGKMLHLGTTTEAARFGELCFLAVAWNAGEDVIAMVRPQLAGKVVIDVTNPLVFNESGPPQLAIGHTTSGGEMVQHMLPDSHVVKALNIINHKNMVSPKFRKGEPIMFICGNNKSAVNHTAELLQELGWNDIVDLGGIEKSRLLESLCLLWVEYGVARGTWKHAFAVLTD